MNSVNAIGYVGIHEFCVRWIECDNAFVYLYRRFQEDQHEDFQQDQQQD